MNRDKFLMLVRREFWENKSLWIAPLAGAGFIIAGLLYAGRFTGGIGAPGPNMSEVGQRAVQGTLMGTAAFLAVIATITTGIYLLDCLYAERKDRSILFWKSLPVSDTQTVLSKLAVAMLVVPLGVLLLTLLLQPVLMAVVWFRVPGAREFLTLNVAGGWLPAIGHLSILWLYAVLWYLPGAAYLMLASVFARRVPGLHALLPILLVVLWDNLLGDGTRQVTRFVLRRLSIPGDGAAGNLLRADGNLLLPFQDLNLWVGLAVGAGMLYTVIRLRRYRDDT